MRSPPTLYLRNEAPPTLYLIDDASYNLVFIGAGLQEVDPYVFYQRKDYIPWDQTDGPSVAPADLHRGQAWPLRTCVRGQRGRCGLAPGAKMSAAAHGQRPCVAAAGKILNMPLLKK